MSPASSNLVILFVNIQCVRNKINLLEASLQDLDVNILCLAEHWLNEEETVDLSINNLNVAEHFARKCHIHGGVAQLTDSSIYYEPLHLIKNLSIELHCELAATLLPELNLISITVYRSPKGDINIFCETIAKLFSLIDYNTKHVLLVGDFNVHFCTGDPRAQLVSDLLLSYGLQSFVQFPTRNTAQLDNVFSNVPLNNISTHPLDLNLSDHLGLLISLNVTHPSTNPITKIFRPMTECGKVTFFNLLSSVNWDFVNTDIDVNNKFGMFLNTVLFNYKIAFPEKKFVYGAPRSTAPNNVWFSPELRKMRETLAFLADAYKLHGTVELKELLIEFKKKYNSAVRCSKIKANDRYIRENRNNPRAMWKLLPKNKLKSNMKTTVLTSDRFNNFFSNIAESISSSLPQPTCDPISLMNSINTPTLFHFQTVSPIEVRDALESLRNSKAKDAYELNVAHLKIVKNILISPLTKLFNQCIQEHVFPDCLKFANVIPLYKKGDIDDPTNYRPISLLPVLSKIFEKLLLKQLVTYLHVNNILSSKQFGFSKGLSTTDAIIALVNNVIESFENKETYAAAFLDLSKAFDCISHEILLRKLYLLNFHPTSIKLIMSYLSNRTQQVFFNGKTSDAASIVRGVPQGSILGPILFLIYINDFPEYLSNIHVNLYADDTTIGNSDTSVEAATRNLSISLSQAEDWYIANRLSLNQNKTIKLLFGCRESDGHGHFSNDTNYLEVHIDSGLTWGKHGDFLAAKISRNIFLLRRLANNLSPHNLRIIYFALVNSHLEYAILVWGHSSSLQRLFKLQRRSARIIAGLGYRDPCRQAFTQINILTLPSLYIFKCLKYLLENPEKYPKLSSYHSYTTRTENLSHLNLRLTKSRDATHYYCIKFYNVLPHRIKLLQGKTFLRKFKVYLIKKAFYSFDEYIKNNFDDFESQT